MMTDNQYAGLLHHVEIYVSNLTEATKFWDWFLSMLGYARYQEWVHGISWKLGPTYLVFVQVGEPYKNSPYDRNGIGLNHLAFHARNRQHVDEIYAKLVNSGIGILKDARTDEHDVNYAIIFEAPDQILVEVMVAR